MSLQENAKSDQSESPFHNHNLDFKKMIISADKDVEQLKLLPTADGCVSLHDCFGKYLVPSCKIEHSRNRGSWPFHSQVHALEKLPQKFSRIEVQETFPASLFLI